MEDDVPHTSVAEQNVYSQLDDENGNSEPHDNTIYLTLISMFPNVDNDYIKQICIEPPFDLNENDDPLVMFINHLICYNEQVDQSYVSELEKLDIAESKNKLEDANLSEELQLQDLHMIEIEKQLEDQLNEQLFSEFLQQDEEIVNERLDVMINILPDADPEFLRRFIVENHDDTMSLQNFVETNLIDKNYIKRNDYYAKKQKQNYIEQYATNFSVEKFIQDFPEPFEHFESTERKGTYQEKALNFLKSRHNNLTEQYLKNIYASNGYNLSLADKHILSSNFFEPPASDNFETDDFVLLQEMAFIRNKNLIKLHLDDLKQKEEKELQILRAKKLLLECQCCYDELRPTNCIECDKSHIFCSRCVIKGTNVAIANGQTSVQCFMGCDQEINLNVLRQVLPESTFEKLLKKRQEAEVEAAHIVGLVTCPFCPFQMELAPQIKIFTCKNPECMIITCRSCKKRNHLPILCQDVLDDEKGRIFVEEEMSKALIRNCYKCQKPFVKEDGCNKMQCSCGALMCYICRQPISGYEHFDRIGSCTTHQNSVIFDKEQVELSRIQATTKLRNDFPDIKIPDI